MKNILVSVYSKFYFYEKAWIKQGKQDDHFYFKN